VRMNGEALNGTFSEFINKTKFIESRIKLLELIAANKLNKSQ